MQPLKRNLLSTALASATLMMVSTAYAQTADQNQAQAEDLDTLEVVGIRRSIQESIDAKQASTSIVEAISSEDIGKLPDTSIADSIARLPGLTAQRFGNRPQEINIRGFAGDFSTALLNGREQVSLGNNRGVEFDQYPGELTSQVLVYKTTDAQLIGQGLSGTVNLKTIRPLAFGKRAFAVNLRGDQNDLEGDKNYGNRFSFSYVDQFADNTVGLALGYARLNNPGQGHQFESWGYDNGVLGGGKLYDFESDNKRDGVFATIEFKPNDTYSSVLDIFYSKFDKEEVKRGMEFGLVFGPPGAPLTRVDNADGTAVQATFANFDPVIRNDFNAAYDDLFSIGWNHTLQLNEHWSVSADISGSSATRNERILETYGGLPTGTAGDNVAISLNSDGYFDFDFGYDYADPNNIVLTDAGGWGQDGYIKDFKVEDSLVSLRLDAERTFDSGWFSSLEFGVNLTDRNKSRASNESFLCLNACRDGAEVDVPASAFTGSGFGYAGLNGILGWDALSLYNNLYNRRSNTNNGDINAKNWEVSEDVFTAYVQANINTELGSIPVKGNLGLQMVNADQSSTGIATFEGVTLSEEASRGASYTHFLPSLNLSFELPANQFLRVGASRQMARPRMDDLRANAGFSIDRTRDIWTGGGGNSELKPWIANAYDLSWELYFGESKAYVSAAYFFKDLKTYIYNQVTEFDFSQLPIPPNVLPADIPPSSIGEYTQPVNGDGGTIKGYELAVSLPLDVLWEPLEGFGLQANYSDTSSSISPNGPGSSEPLPGLSKYVANITAYYERFGFSARVAQRHRSQFVGEVQGFGGDRTKIAFNGESVTDVQLGYTLQSGPMKDLSFLLQVNNLENEPFSSSYDGRSDRPRQYFEYGRTYLLGVNYRF
ncbi:MAG: TonB-dependent receptor [Xanthomonadales bacterium]|nr:TonB-dependent receptor [Xanthomonadales bacterium]